VQLPCDHQVARRVTDAHGTPVDHTADAPIPDEPVACIEVAVVPDGRPVPGRRRERTFPLGRHHRVAVEPRQPVTDLPVAIGQRNAASRRGARRIHLLEHSDKRRKITCRLDRVDLLDRHGFAFDPCVDIQNQG
jgi:hypothetical protein